MTVTMPEITVNQVATSIVKLGTAIAFVFAAWWFVDDRHMNAAAIAELTAEVFTLNLFHARLLGTRALYDARLEVDGYLSPVDAARRMNLAEEIQAMTELSRSLQVQIQALR